MSKPKADENYSWLDQLATEGPFLSLPVVKSVWPHGVDRLGDTDDRATTFKQAYADWLRAYDARSYGNRDEYAEITRGWINTVLDKLADWDELRVGQDELIPRRSHLSGRSDMEIHSPGEQVRIRPHGALAGREGDYAALLRVIEPSDDLRGPGLDGWSASEIDRMATLLRRAQVDIGIVTDGRWWGIVWAHSGKPTGSAITDAATWGEEPLVRDAFLTLINQRRFRAKDVDERLIKLLERSELEAEEVTEALGAQVRKAVELLVGSFSRARLEALAAGEADPLPDEDDDVYQAAVTVMMRVVFLLFAEERGMLPTDKLYWDSYAIRGALDDLQKRAAHGEELLDETYDTWHRLLAVSDALHGGVNYDEMRMPAYGGSLLDPYRFPWLCATDGRGLRIKVRDRVMLHVLRSVQYANIGKEARRISFRDIDVEQIGYIYEGLLGYTAVTVKDNVTLGLIGKPSKPAQEPDVDAATLYALASESSDVKVFATSLIERTKNAQPSAEPATPAAIKKAYEYNLTDEERAEVTRQLTPIVGYDTNLLDLLVRWSPLIRRDLRGIPLVVPVDGLVVTETPSRKHAGAHYTPRSLAEEVVRHALEPLVYEPGPLQESDRDKWQLKASTAILNLKVADIAAGSGAFLVAAARFLAQRVVEAWATEGAIARYEKNCSDRAYERALREVVSRCLYGADINPMAVEMCKLSLWLVSLDPTKPFSFVDDKIFCGNSLLGVSSINQLRHLHVYPDTKKHDLITELVDVDAKLVEASRIRRELANPVVEHDPMRTRAAKERLLKQAKEVTAQLRDIADNVVAAALRHGGKPGAKLDDSFAALSWALAEAYPRDGSESDRTKVDSILEEGLTPSVRSDYERWQPLHWFLEVPDVVVDHGGFDAIIGNPPFLVHKRISSAIGSIEREYLVHQLGGGMTAKVDLVSLFVLQAHRLLRGGGGILGLITSKAVAEGATRKFGLGQLTDGANAKSRIFRAVRSRDWPGSASTQFSVVWLAHNMSVRPGCCHIDGVRVDQVNSMLEEGRMGRVPIRLRGNRGLCHQGVITQGSGFFVDTHTGDALRRVSENRDVVRPYLGGKDVSDSSTLSPSRYVIDFGEMTEAQARQYEEPWDLLIRDVKPERLMKDPEKYPRMVHEWWKHWNPRREMRSVLSQLSSYLVIVGHTKYLVPARVPADLVPSSALRVFCSESYILQAVLASSIHSEWAIHWGSTLGSSTIRYNPSTVFETFPIPENHSHLGPVGRMFDASVRDVLQRRGLGLTKLYNLVNDPNVQGDIDVDRLREIHCELDEATLDAYGWNDLLLDHGFYTYRRMERWTVSPASRVKILDRLLELNHERASAEGQDVPGRDALF